MDKINKKLCLYLESHICDNVIQLLTLMMKENSAKIKFDTNSQYYQHLKDSLGED